MDACDNQAQLLTAVACVDLPAAQHLLADGLNPNFEGNCFWVSPLALAVFVGSRELCQLLLHYKAAPTSSISRRTFRR